MDEDLLPALPAGQDRCLDRGEALFRVGDPALGLVLLREGALEFVRTSPEGRRLVLHRAGPGDCFAEASRTETRHHCDAIAAAADPALGWRVAAHLAARLVAERARAGRLALPHAADRFLDVLHALPLEPDGARRLDQSWKALAAELGLSHEATYRAPARLERTGRLRRGGDGRARLPATVAA